MAELHRVYQAQRQDAGHVVFVHGLGGDAKRTWMSQPDLPSTLWPAWVGEDLQCNVWCLGYDAALSRWTDSAMDIPKQGQAVMNALNVESRLDRGAVILVAHSLGGIVVKAALLSAAQQAGADARVLTRILGVAFLATPHQGSQLANLAQALNALFRVNPQIGRLRSNDAYLDDLNQRFRALFVERQLKALVLREESPVAARGKLLGVLPRLVKVLVVEPGSADPGLSGVQPRSEPEDHFSIAKPAGRDRTLYKTILQFLRETVAEVPAAAGRPAPAPVSPVSSPASVSPSPPPGLLLGSQDKRLLPREGRVLGRDDEMAKLLHYLRGGDGETGRFVFSALALVGAGGVGKTEVCKGALRLWLKADGGAQIYYVGLPDRGGVPALIEALAQATGSSPDQSFRQVLQGLPAALYYLDNLEGAGADAESLKALSALVERAGIRVLASSRVSLPSVFRQEFELDALPESAALSLFESTWRQTRPSEPELPVETLRLFVCEDLGRHALSISLCARLGDCYTFADLRGRWQELGSALAKDLQADDRLNSLDTSLALTAGAVADQQPGALQLWLLAALCPDGLPEDLLSRFEAAAGWPAQVRQLLVRHHVLTRRSGRFWLLPPLARHALACSQGGAVGFEWAACRSVFRAVFDPQCLAVACIASTDEALAAKAWLVAHFSALAQFMLGELRLPEPDREWLASTHFRIRNLYLFQIQLARSVLAELIRCDVQRGSALVRLGDLESRLDELGKARASYDEALGVYMKDNDSLGQASALWSLGDLESEFGDVSKARTLYNQALELYRQEGNGLGQANTLRSLGDLERRSSELERASVLYDEAVSLYRKESDGLGLANTLRSKGDLERHLGEMGKAKALYDEALRLYAREQDPIGAAFALAELARCLHALKLPQQTNEALRQAVSASKRTDDASLVRYVISVIEEIKGGAEAARCWLDADAP